MPMTRALTSRTQNIPASTSTSFRFLLPLAFYSKVKKSLADMPTIRRYFFKEKRFNISPHPYRLSFALSFRVTQYIILKVGGSLQIRK